MNRRDMFKALPVAAMAMIDVQTGEITARAATLDPNKEYIFSVPGMDPEMAERFVAWASKRVKHGVVIPHPMEIYEL